MIRYGFILLHRSLLDWEWYQNPNTLRLFLHLLLTVNYQDKPYCGVTIKRGQRLTSYAQLAQELKVGEKTIRTSVEHLKRTGEVAHEKVLNASLITVTAYDKYQQGAGNWADEGQFVGGQQTDKGQTDGNYVSNKIKKTKEKKRQSFAEGASFDLEAIEAVMKANVLQGISKIETGGIGDGKETA